MRHFVPATASTYWRVTVAVPDSRLQEVQRGALGGEEAARRAFEPAELLARAHGSPSCADQVTRTLGSISTEDCIEPRVGRTGLRLRA